MLLYALICLVSFCTAGLTMYSGFGLGTLLMPVFALLFPLEVAVAATAVVHGANNFFKLLLLGKYADRSLVLRFGIPAVAAALVGAGALGYVSHLGEMVRYSIGTKTAVITPIKVIMAILIFTFSMFELLPRLRDWKVRHKHLIWGGLLSGFFGGFSGHQGALRSAFLLKVGVSTETFVGTNAAIGSLVDLTRVAMYAALFLSAGATIPIDHSQGALICAATLSAFAGVVIGKRFLHKVTMKSIQTFTGAALLAIAFAIGSGLV